MRIFAGIGLTFLTVLVAGCANPPEKRAALSGPVPKPDHIYVAYYSVAPDQVGIDRGVSIRVNRAVGDPSLPERDLLAAQRARADLAIAVVEQLNKLGLPAEIATNNTAIGDGLLLQGQIAGPDPRNKSQLALVGLNGGKGPINAETQLFQVASGAPPRLLTTFRAPGGDGSITGADHALMTTAAETIAARIARFAADQGWTRLTAAK